MEYPEWERFEDPLERYHNYISKRFGADARSKARVAMAQDRNRGRPYKEICAEYRIDRESAQYEVERGRQILRKADLKVRNLRVRAALSAEQDQGPDYHLERLRYGATSGAAPLLAEMLIALAH